VGVDKWDDKAIEALPLNVNKKIQVFSNSTRELGLQATFFTLHFAKSVNTTETMADLREHKDSGTLTDID